MLRRHRLRGLFSRLRAAKARACLDGLGQARGRRAVETLETRVLPAVTFQFDYSRDTEGFFDDTARRDVLEEAGNQVGGLLEDVLFEIVPHQLDVADTWTAQFADPSTGGTFDVVDLIIGEDTIVVYVGARDLGGNLALGGPASIPSVSGVQEFVDTVIARGQLGALDAVATDFGPFGGAISFDTTTNWHFDSLTDGLDAGEFDFLSTAIHELMHVIGFGTSASFSNLVSGGVFTGGQASVEYELGGSVPMNDPGHWRQSLMDDGQQTAMDPDLADGTRELLTGLDVAALADIGWEVAPGGGLTSPTILLAGLTPNSVVISDNATPNDGLSQYTVNGDPPIEFSTTTSNLFIAGGCMADTIEVSSLDDQFSADIFVNGGNGDDLLDIDYSVSDTFTYNGQGGNDSLALQGLAAMQVEHTFFNASDGSVSVTAPSAADVFYTGLEPIDDLIAATSRIFTFFDTTDVVTLEDDAIAGNGLSTIRSVSSSETVNFTNLTGQVVINAAGGDDSVSILALDSLFAGSVSVSGGDGNDDLDGSAATVALQLSGNTGQDTIKGGSGNDSLSGGDDNDQLVAGGGDDAVDGNDGDDALSGEGGNDTLDGGDGTDRLVESADVNLTVLAASLTGIGNDVFSSIEAAEISGGISDNVIDVSGFAGPTTVRAGAGDDTVTGSVENDVLSGEGGDDLINGGNGNDQVCGGNGNDSLNGDDGNDVLRGEGQDDVLKGGLGRDTLNGNQGNDDIDGGDGNDIAFGGGGADTLRGGDGNDRLRGQSAFDVLTGGAGRDTLSGGGGRDRVIEANDADFVLRQFRLRGNGVDRLVSIEQVELTGGASNNSLSAVGYRGQVTLRGGDGDDTLTGGGNNDVLQGDAGSDLLTGNGGLDLLSGGTGADTLNGNDGDDTLQGEDGNDRLFGGTGNDNLDGGNNIDRLSGDEGNDTLLGGDGNDRLFGGTGDDSLRGGDQNDRLFGEDGNDTLIGDAGNDTLNGGQGRDGLDGFTGNDRLKGGGADDTLFGGDGNDTLEGEGGIDIVIGMAGDDRVNGGGSVDILAGGSGSGADPGDVVLEPDEADEFFTITPPDWVLSTF